MNLDLIAPCGMNCGICAWHLGERKCLGCRQGTRRCGRVFKCSTFKKNKYEFCFECAKFPCKNLKTLDKRYRTRYSMSSIANLKYIKSKGVNDFIKSQEKKYKCPSCKKGIVCVHDGKCYSCKK